MMFTQRTLDFLYHNRRNNSPDWYKAHKQDYQKYVLLPFEQLVKDLREPMLSIDPKFVVEPKVDMTISRIYRDMRFASDGYRYRENVWCIFARDKRAYKGYPGYYFEVSPYNFSYGCGYYSTEPATMENLRKLILSGSEEFQRAEQCVASQKTFSIYGDKRNSLQGQSQIATELINRANLGLSVQSMDINLLFSDKLSKILAERFLKIKPFYDLLIKAESMRKEK